MVRPSHRWAWWISAPLPTQGAQGNRKHGLCSLGEAPAGLAKLPQPQPGWGWGEREGGLALSLGW